MAKEDEVGWRGEAIFVTCLTEFCGRDLPYFRPRFLGEKAQVLDFLVELLGTSSPAFFFVQVKATRKGYTKRPPRRLKIDLTEEEMRRFASYPAPVYLAGIDEPQKLAYLLAVLASTQEAIPSFPTSFPLDCANLARLYDEVRQFWTGRDMALRRSCFAVERGGDA
jgi:hypothetical protein